MTGVISGMRACSSALIWFSANPDEYLTLQDMQDKWGGGMDAITTGLRYAVDAGLLTKSRHPDDLSRNGRRTRYEAGPAIRQVLGLEEEE